MNADTTKPAAPSLVGRLDAEYTQAAQSNRAERVKELRELAAKARGIQEIYTSPWFMIAIAVFVGIPITILCLYKFSQIAVHWNDPHFADVKNWKWWGVSFVILGIAPLLAAVVSLRNAKKPWLVFSEQGLVGSYLAKPLPWAAIEDYLVTTHTYNFVPTGLLYLTLTLHDGVENLVVQKNGKPYKKSRLTSKPQILLITGNKIRGMNGKKFSECFRTWWHAGLARAELAQMGES